MCGGEGAWRAKEASQFRMGVDGYRAESLGSPWLKGNFDEPISQITLSYGAVTNKPQFCPKRLDRNDSHGFQSKSRLANTRSGKGKIHIVVFRVKNLLPF
jgi:hypothetical protein